VRARSKTTGQLSCSTRCSEDPYPLAGQSPDRELDRRGRGTVEPLGVVERDDDVLLSCQQAQKRQHSRADGAPLRRRAARLGP
jgi:hypothetical protein